MTICELVDICVLVRSRTVILVILFIVSYGVAEIEL